MKRTRLSRNGNSSMRRQRVTKVTSAKDLGNAFFEGRNLKFGYTPRGVRDRIETEGSVTNYYLWDNNIATLDRSKNLLTIRDTGWKTSTTKDRLDNILRSKFDYGTYVSQQRNVWYLFHNNKKYVWSDGDNKIDLSNPARFLTPFKEKAFKATVKEQAKLSAGFVNRFKDKILSKRMTPEDFDELSEVFQERGRPPMFEMAFLRNEQGQWDYDKMREHLDLIKMDLRWYARHKIQKGETEELKE